MANDSATSRNIRIGLVVGASLLALMTFIFFIGSEQKLFSKKNDYLVRLENVSGLAEGNPVQMAGVNIGVVRDIRLPESPQDRTVKITVSVQEKYAERVRTDSTAKLRKLGLIAADSYIDITPGSPTKSVLPPDSEIPSAKATDVDRLISSGEDLVDNFVQISYSLKNILGRVDRGEGLLGELTTDPRSKQRITDTFLATMNRTNEVLEKVQSGRGLIGKMVYDDAYAAELTTSIRSSAQSMQAILASLQYGVEKGEGAVPALLSDPRGKANIMTMLDNLRLASENVATFTTSLQTGEGIVPRLMNDKVYADQAMGEFKTLIGKLSETVGKLNNGEGTAGRLISDPSIYESINDILIGINESKLLRWLIRDRQGAGIQTRYKAQTTGRAPGETVAPDIPSIPPKKTEPDGVPPAVDAEPPATSTAPADGATTTTTTTVITATTTEEVAPPTDTAPPPNP